MGNHPGRFNEPSQPVWGRELNQGTTLLAKCIDYPCFVWHREMIKSFRVQERGKIEPARDWIFVGLHCCKFFTAGAIYNMQDMTHKEIQRRNPDHAYKRASRMTSTTSLCVLCYLRRRTGERDRGEEERDLDSARRRGCVPNRQSLLDSLIGVFDFRQWAISNSKYFSLQQLHTLRSDSK